MSNDLNTGKSFKPGTGDVKACWEKRGSFLWDAFASARERRFWSFGVSSTTLPPGRRGCCYAHGTPTRTSTPTGTADYADGDKMAALTDT